MWLELHEEIIALKKNVNMQRGKKGDTRKRNKNESQEEQEGGKGIESSLALQVTTPEVRPALPPLVPKALTNQSQIYLAALIPTG